MIRQHTLLGLQAVHQHNLTDDRYTRQKRCEQVVSKHKHSGTCMLVQTVLYVLLLLAVSREGTDLHRKC